MNLRPSLPFAFLMFTASAAGVACGARDGSRAGDVDEGTVQAPLYGEGALAKPWPNGIVPVCFADPSAFPDAQHLIASTLANTWTLAANISFTGFGACAPSGNQVTIVFSPESNFPGATSALGYGPRTVTLKSNDILPLSPGVLSSAFQMEVVREMGHVLGFANEAQRPDNWTGGTASHCPDAGDRFQNAPLDGGTYFTATYDSDSIMNTCRTTGGGLSAGDIAGARAVYGAPTASTPSVPGGCGYTLIDCNPQTLHYRFSCAQPASLRPGESAVLRGNEPLGTFPIVATATSTTPTVDYTFAQYSTTGVFYLCIDNGLLESCSSMFWVPDVDTSPQCAGSAGDPGGGTVQCRPGMISCGDHCQKAGTTCW